MSYLQTVTSLFSLRRCCYSKYWCTIIRTVAWQPSQTAMDVRLQHLKANSIDCIHTYRQQCQMTSHHHQQLWSNLSLSNRHSTRDVACRVCDSISTHTSVILASICGYHIQHRVLIVFLWPPIISKNYIVKLERLFKYHHLGQSKFINFLYHPFRVFVSCAYVEIQAQFYHI